MKLKSVKKIKKNKKNRLDYGIKTLFVFAFSIFFLFGVIIGSVSVHNVNAFIFGSVNQVSKWTDTGSYIYANNSSSTVITDSGYLGIGTNNPEYPLTVEVPTINTNTRAEVASVLDNTATTGTNPTLAYFSASNPSDRYPRAVFGIGHDTDDVNTALTIYPEFGTNANPITTHMFIQLAKSNGADTPIGGISLNNNNMVIFSTKYKGSYTGNPIVLSTQSYSDSNGLVVGTNADQPIIIGPSYWDYGSQLFV